MKAEKTNSYKKMGLIMLAATVAGGVLGGLGMFILDGRLDDIENGMVSFLGRIQQIQFLLLTGITALTVIFGEWNIRKLKTIGRQIQATEDEECDKWEYEEERAGAQGMIVNIISQIMCILILSVGYSVRYIENDHTFSMLASCIVFLACYVYNGFWQVRYVKLTQANHPGKEGDPASRKFQQQWIESCDEAEKEMIYQSSYKAYIKMNHLIPLLLIVAMLGHLFFETGIMAIVMVAAVWLALSGTYLHSCVGLKGEKLR